MKNILKAFLLVGAVLLTSCVPQGQGVQAPPSDRVNEQAINSLSSNKWCQQNPTSDAPEYVWVFNKNLTATANPVNSQEQNGYLWLINSDNFITVFTPENIALFTKKISYNYNINLQKRTMLWIDPQPQQTCNPQGICQIASTSTTKFIECDL